MASGTGSATTIRSDGALVLLAFLVFPLGAAAVGGGWWLSARIPAAGVAAYSGAAAVPVIWFVVRVLRAGVRFDDRGITVRDLFRTRRIAWPQVSSLTDAPYKPPVSADYPLEWGVKVVLKDGSAVQTIPLAEGPEAPAELLERIRNCAARYGISDELTDVRPRYFEPGPL
jgi:Bacterial PH domain